MSEAEERWARAKRRRGDNDEEEDDERPAKKQSSDIARLLERGIQVLEGWKESTDRWIAVMERRAEEAEVAQTLRQVD